jgi:hypothetical protein
MRMPLYQTDKEVTQIHGYWITMLTNCHLAINANVD